MTASTTPTRNGSPVDAHRPDALAAAATTAIREVARKLQAAVASHGISEPRDHRVRLRFESRAAASHRLPSGWQPAAAFEYTSEDPFQLANPRITAAVEDLIGEAVRQALTLRGANDATLTYLSAQRSRGGRSRGPVTRALAELDRGFTDWMDNLPAAERLRPVAHPEPGGTTVVHDRATGRFSELPTTPVMSAIFIGAADGRGVREREAWTREATTRLVDPERLPQGRLTMTSLGTGTGEPVMDTGIEAMLHHFGSRARVVVNGYDINETSLTIAAHMAQRKCRELERPDLVTFVPRVANLLSTDGIRKAVAGTSAHVYESIGFMEYVPSEHASDGIERNQRQIMKRLGCLSAEGFYRDVYANMPRGSVLLTGNMRDDSPQAPFVVDGVGWKGIIQRSTSEYLTIIDRAGIPPAAVQLFVPSREGSSGVYNLVAITKH